MVDSTDAGGAPLPLDQALDAAGDSALTGTDAGMMSAHAELSPQQSVDSRCAVQWRTGTGSPQMNLERRGTAPLREAALTLSVRRWPAGSLSSSSCACVRVCACVCVVCAHSSASVFFEDDFDFVDSPLCSA